MNQKDMIDEALAEWRVINKYPGKWCRFEAANFGSMVSVGLKVGNILDNGVKETAFETRMRTLYANGRYDKYIVAHL